MKIREVRFEDQRSRISEDQRNQISEDQISEDQISEDQISEDQTSDMIRDRSKQSMTGLIRKDL